MAAERRYRGKLRRYIGLPAARLCVNPVFRPAFVEVLRKLDAEQPRPNYLIRALATVLRGGICEEHLIGLIDQNDVLGQARLLFLMRTMDSSGLIVRTIEDEDGFLVATIEPIVLGKIADICFSENEKICLSPYALVRLDGADLVAEIPLGFSRIRIHDSVALGVLYELIKPKEVKIILSALPSRLNGSSGVTLIAALLGSGIAERLDSEIIASQQACDEGWQFHDLWFHARSREGWANVPFGATRRLEGKISAAPVLKHPCPGRSISLPQPRDSAEDLSFFSVLNARKSERRGRKLITKQSLSELLYYSARVKAITKAPDGSEITQRPYPSGGACYALEIYLVIGDSVDIEEGIYYFSPLKHEIYRLSEENVATPFLEHAKVAANASENPGAVIVITARFKRVAWKYESIAYSLILKDAGALMQTISLTATALSLATCPIGNGNGKKFCESIGLNFISESPVAEFAIFGSL